MPMFQPDDLLVDVKARLERKGYVLLESEEHPAIQQAEYDFILKYYNSLQPLQDRQLQVLIILQLTFLYGLSLSTIKNLCLRDINMETRTIEILSKSKAEKIVLELPYSIYKNIELHIKNSGIHDDDLLFFTLNTSGKQNKPISSSFILNDLKTIRDQYILDQKHDEYIADRFTHYGAIKYAIANMLECGMNISSIINLTGRDIRFILSCKPQNALNSKQHSNYINCKLRLTRVFSEFNEYES